MLEKVLPRRLSIWLVSALVLAVLWWLYGWKQGHYEDRQEAVLAALLTVIQVGILFTLLLLLRAVAVAVRRFWLRRNAGPGADSPGPGPRT
jgi:hypothetical protein